MQYTPHYNLNLPEGSDIVNPLIQDNPNYSAIDTALYDNKLRVVGTATHTKTGTNHSIVLADSDIPVFRFVATGDYATGDTFSVDGVTVTPRIADGSTIPTGAFKINSTVFAILDGTILNLIGIQPDIGQIPGSDVILSDGKSVEETLIRGNITVTADGVKTFADIFNELYAISDHSKISRDSYILFGNIKFYYGSSGYNSYEYNANVLGGSPQQVCIAVINMSTSSRYEWWYMTPGGVSHNDLNNSVAPQYQTFTLYY